MARAKKPKRTVCINCGEDVRAIEGKILTRGNAASWRHVVRPDQSCIIGDPLMDRQVKEV